MVVVYSPQIMSVKPYDKDLFLTDARYTHPKLRLKKVIPVYMTDEMYLRVLEESKNHSSPPEWIRQVIEKAFNE